jgi:hypothetical protein
MTDKADKVHPVVKAMIRKMTAAERKLSDDRYALPGNKRPPFKEYQKAVARAHAKAAAKVLIEECAKKVPSNWLDPSVAHMRGAGPITCSDVELAMQNTAAHIRSLKTELGLEG